MTARKTNKSNKTGKPPRSEEEREKFKRKHRQSFRLNDLEYKALMQYFKKYKVENRAKFMREAIMTVVLKKFDDDYPTLFELPAAIEPNADKKS